MGRMVVLRQACPSHAVSGAIFDTVSVLDFIAALVQAMAWPVVVLIIALDYPFRGEISITPAPFIMTQQSWTGLSLDKKRALRLEVCRN